MPVSYISTLLEFACVYYIAKSFLHVSYKPTKNDCIAFTLFFLIFCQLSESPPILPWLIGQIIYFVYLTSFNTKNILHSILLFCLTVTCIVIIQFFATPIIYLLPTNLNSDVFGVCGSITTFALIILIFQSKHMRDLYYKIVHSILPYRLILINSYLIIFALLLLFKMNPSELYHNLISTLIIVFIVIIANGCVLYYDQKMFTQQQQLLSYQKNLPIYESLIHEIRDNQHEYSNRIQSLQNLTETCKDYDTLKTAIKKYTYHYAQPLHAYPLLQINMPLLAASLYNLSCRAENDGIVIQFDVISEQLHSHATEIQLSDFATTLLQNAIEACETGDNIYVHLSSSDGIVALEIRNPVKQFYPPQDIAKFFQKNYSTKKSNVKNDIVPHGIGLFNLMKEVTKLKGTIGADCIEYNDKYWIIFRLKV